MPNVVTSGYTVTVTPQGRCVPSELPPVREGDTIRVAFDLKPILAGDAISSTYDITADYLTVSGVSRWNDDTQIEGEVTGFRPGLHDLKLSAAFQGESVINKTVRVRCLSECE